MSISMSSSTALQARQKMVSATAQLQVSYTACFQSLISFMVSEARCYQLFSALALPPGSSLGVVLASAVKWAAAPISPAGKEWSGKK